MGMLLPFQPAADDFPNHLALPEPERRRLPPAGWLLAALVLLCVVPRTMMALRLTSVCPDGVLYIHAAKALEAGDLRAAFRDLDLNLYPIVLAGLHRLGLGWELGAAVWGVAVSSLVVLPLWGWARRQFDDRTALLACLLYAAHPKFIEWSPEVMRDPTFWLLFMLAIYWTWRAASEVRHRYFIAAGAAIVLAALTRIEGLFLLLPLGLWTFWRGRALKPASARRKLLLGATLCVAIFPALLLLINLLWLRGRYGWTMFRLDPLAHVHSWLAHLFGGPPAAEGVEVVAPMSVGRMAWVYFPTLTRGLSPVFALLMLGGIWGWRRVWSRRDHQPLFYTALAVLCGIWIHLWYGGDICPRYALPIVLMAAPFAALGLLGFVDRLSRFAGRLRLSASPTAIATVVFGAVFVGSLTDAMTCNRSYFAGRRTDAAVGRWILREFQRPLVLAGPPGATPIASYYAAGAPYRMFSCGSSDDYILKTIRDGRAHVVLLRPAKELTAERCAAIVGRARELGLLPVRPEKMPVDEPGFVILVRRERKDLVE